MADPYLGEIRMFAGTFAPRGWAFCGGQLLSVSQNDALFSLLGTIYGGDGRTTFGLPDLRGRIPIHAGSGPGLTPRALGAKQGAENVTLTIGQTPTHGHAMQGSSSPGTGSNPANAVVASSPSVLLHIEEAPTVGLSSQAIDDAGGSQSHRNLMPSLGINFIIALSGIFPTSS